MKLRKILTITLFVCSLAGLAFSACSPRTVKHNTYKGTFTYQLPKNVAVDLNYLEIVVIIGGGEVRGSGARIMHTLPKLEGEANMTDTQKFAFTGTYDPDSKTITGFVHITGGLVCGVPCAPYEDTNYDYEAKWSATLSKNYETLTGVVDGPGEIEASLVENAE